MKSLAVLLAGTALAVGANAATISFDFSNPFETTEINQSGNLGLFDTNLGVLTGVSLSFSGGNTTLLSLTNTAAQQQTVRATSTTDLFFGSSLGALDALIVAANPVISLSASTGFVSLASGATQTFGPLTDADTITWSNQVAGILGSFGAAGGGTFGISCESLSGIAITGGGGNVSSSQRTQAGCGAAITYTYEQRQQVPEPGALALVGIALAGLALSRRRKA